MVFTEHHITLKNLPASFENLKIAHISDLHFGQFSNQEFIKELLDRILEQQPDWIFLTGDYVDASETRFSSQLTQALENLGDRCPSFAVLGNHEFYHGVVSLIVPELFFFFPAGT